MNRPTDATMSRRRRAVLEQLHEGTGHTVAELALALQRDEALKHTKDRVRAVLAGLEAGGFAMPRGLAADGRSVLWCRTPVGAQLLELTESSPNSESEAVPA